MLPTPQPQQPQHVHQMQHVTNPEEAGVGGGAAEGAGAGPALHPTLRASSLREGGGGGEKSPGGAGGVVLSTAGGDGGGGGGGGTGGGVERAKVKSIKMMDRLQPSELLRVSLPFKEVSTVGQGSEELGWEWG